MDRETVVETGVVTSLTRGRSVARTFVCRVQEDGSRSVMLGARPILIGADPTCDLILEDPKVSRRHAELSVVGGEVQIRDLGSTNGTFVDAVRIDVANIATGVVRCGDNTIRVSENTPPTVEPSGRDRFGALVGESLFMRELFAVLELVSNTEATILIQAASGSGKELAARAVHDHSERAEGPFVVMDCSAASDELIESQLFGHRKGAFTGAQADRKGAFVAAGCGTLFLDEIGELSLNAQSRLLRALEARTVTPLGADAAVSVDTRVVAATHRDLKRMVEQKRFRFDLFHRLAVVHIEIPPLRDRLEDLPCLVRHFYTDRGIEPGEVAGENLERLQRHTWPGNVRELRNVLERSWVLSRQEQQRFTDLNLWIDAGEVSSCDVVDTTLPFKQAKERWVASFARRYLAVVYEQHGRNITRAAEHAGINRRHFRELLEHHGLKKEK